MFFGIDEHGVIHSNLRCIRRKIEQIEEIHRRCSGCKKIGHKEDMVSEMSDGIPLFYHQDCYLKKAKK